MDNVATPFDIKMDRVYRYKKNGYRVGVAAITMRMGEAWVLLTDNRVMKAKKFLRDYVLSR